MMTLVLGTFSVLLLLAWGTYQTAAYLRHAALTVNPLLLPVENILRLVLVAICLWLGLSSGLPLQVLGWTLEDLARNVALGMGVGLGVSILVPVLTQVAIRYVGANIYSPVVVRSVLPRTRREWLLVPLALVLSVLLEELLFRSLLLGGFGQFVSPILLALIWSVLFGVMHLPQGYLGMIVAAALGLLLSALFVSTMSLVTPLVAHYMINLLQLIWASLDRSWLDTYEIPIDIPK